MSIQDSTRDGVSDYVTGVLRDVTAELDVGEITPDRRLGEFGLESISQVYLVGEIQQHYELNGLLFDALRTRGVMVTELRVADLVDYVCELLGDRIAAASGGER